MVPGQIRVRYQASSELSVERNLRKINSPCTRLEKRRMDSDDMILDPWCLSLRRVLAANNVMRLDDGAGLFTSVMLLDEELKHLPGGAALIEAITVPT